MLQVSGADDYRLQRHDSADTTLPEILDSGPSQQGAGKHMRQGVMHIGPQGRSCLEAVWAEIARTGASQVLCKLFHAWLNATLFTILMCDTLLHVPHLP